MVQFLSNVGVVGAAANGPATVGTNTTTSAGGLWFGTDTNLYRSAASTLATDGSLDAGAHVSAATQLLVGQTSSVFGANGFIDALANLNAAARMEFKNSNVGTAALSSFGLRADTAQFIAQAYSSASTVGVGMSGALGTVSSANLVWLRSVTSNAFIIGHASAAPIGFLTNNVVRAVISDTGLVGIAVNPAASNGFLQLPAGTTLATGGIAWGTDTDLFRQAAGVVQTSGTFRAGTGVRSAAVAVATLGTELLANNSFATDLSSWTAGANWAWDATGAAAHTVGSAATIAQALTGLTAGAYYQLVFTITGRTAGSVTIDLGGSTATLTTAAATASGEYTFVPTSTTPTLTITPTSTFDGMIADVSLKLVTAATTSPQYMLDSTLGSEQARIHADAESNVGMGQNVLTQHLGGAGPLGRGATNVAIGTSALRRDTTGDSNVAVGYLALTGNTVGTQNVAIGAQALDSNISGTNNLAMGTLAMHANTTGGFNSAVGTSALQNNTTGIGNMAFGYSALLSNTTAANNVAIGQLALTLDTTGQQNTALGAYAGYAPAGLAANATTTGSNNTFIGLQSGQGSATQRSNTVAVGYNAVVDGDRAVAIGPAASAGAAGAVALGADSSGTGASTTVANEFKLGTANHTYNLPGATVTLADAASLVLGTTTGLKIGTATGQKIGLWNATPVVQPSGWGTPSGTLTRTTYASDSATLVQVATRLAALITDLKNTGLLGA